MTLSAPRKMNADAINTCAVASGLHVAAAVGSFLAVTIDAGLSVADARKAFLEVCTELWDEAALEAAKGIAR